MPKLYPDYPERVEYYGTDRRPCRPPPTGGCIQLIHWDRALSNRFPEFGPFERFIDRAKLIQGLTLDEVYDQQVYFWSLALSIMGTSQEDRNEFEDFVYPRLGMQCTVTTEAERVPLSEANAPQN